MRKFTPTHWHRNTHMLVTEYNWPIEEQLKGHALVVYIHDLQDIPVIMKHKTEATKIHAFVYESPFSSLEALQLDPGLGQVPLILKLGRMGSFRAVHHIVAQLRQMGATVLLEYSSQALTDARILSSLGVHTGIWMSPDMPLTDELQELITYSFYGRMQHADIEPFATMERYYTGENYVSPAMAQFYHPERYIHVDSEGHLAFTRQELLAGQYFDTGLHLLGDISEHPAIQQRKHAWQEHFTTAHPCTFCPAYRVCQGYFEPQREEGRCREVMTELLEGIEFRKQSQGNQKQEPCQL